MRTSLHRQVRAPEGYVAEHDIVLSPELNEILAGSLTAASDRAVSACTRDPRSCLESPLILQFFASLRRIQTRIRALAHRAV